MPWAPAGSDRGSVTAEFVVLLPAVLVVLASCLSGMALVGHELRLQDAAAATARAVARGDPAPDLLAGATTSRHDEGDLVCVTLRRSGGVGPLAVIPLSATSCALADGQ